MTGSASIAGSVGCSGSKRNCATIASLTTFSKAPPPVSAGRSIGFDLRGNTAAAGYGKHIGDPSLTFGLDITYLPAHFTVDVGALLTQRLLEPFINKGIEANWLLSCQWRF